jgi:hypothetical protein
MIHIPPTRLLGGSLLLLAAFVTAGCERLPPPPAVSPVAARPTPSPTGSAAASQPTVAASPSVGPSAMTRPPRVPFAGLAMLVGPDLVVVGTDGVARHVSGPAEPIEAVAVSAGRVVVRTAGPAFHVARVDDMEAGIEAIRWRRIDIDPGVALRPLAATAPSPDGERVAILAADVGSGEPFQVVIVDVSTAQAVVFDVDREANGPPIWLDDTTILLEIAASSRGGPFVTLDADTGRISATNAAGGAPAISGDGARVAVLGLDPRSSVAVLPTSEWLTGAHGDAAAQLGVPFAASVAGMALDGSGERLAVGVANDDGDPVAIEAYGREPGGWTSIGSIRADVPRWFGWIR